MPESRGRRRRRERDVPDTTRSSTGSAAGPGTTGPGTPSARGTTRPTTQTARPPKPNPVWWVPVMLGLMILGLVWIVVWYVTQNQYPVPGIGSWNLVIGFAVVLVGFLMTTRWR